MRQRKPCTEENCDRNSNSRGLCGMHYELRKRRGTLPELNARTESLQFLFDHVATTSKECIVWPFHINSGGYPMVGMGGRHKRAHRHICEMAHGAPPSAKHDAAHSCLNRACVNPNHLRWATRKENIADGVSAGRVRRGQEHNFAHMTNEEAQAIWQAKGTAREVAERLGVNEWTVYKIRQGKSWAWLTGLEKAS